MRILFTGSSSFTGFWFIKELVSAGHEVIAVYGSYRDAYADLRLKRVEAVKGLCKTVFGCPFGSEAFIELINSLSGLDLLCHHAADVGNYKSPEFDVMTAVGKNTLNIKQVLRTLKSKGCNRLIITGSVFEPNEGAGTEPMRAFSPYGLSKGISADIFRYYSSEMGMSSGKFVIPNPFGPYEEPRFTAYLIMNWKEGKTSQVSTPAYVRDNIHVSLLAMAYTRFAENLPEYPGFRKTNPSGYIESQGAFAKRFAEEMRNRLGMACDLTFANQRDFPDPIVRINTEPVSHLFPNWDETLSWDETAAYYHSMIGRTAMI